MHSFLDSEEIQMTIKKKHISEARGTELSENWKLKASKFIFHGLLMTFVRAHIYLYFICCRFFISFSFSFYFSFSIACLFWRMYSKWDDTTYEYDVGTWNDGTHYFTVASFYPRNSKKLYKPFILNYFEWTLWRKICARMCS